MSLDWETTAVAGRYELGPVLGYGGMSEVFRARDTRLERDVAIKFLHPELAAKPLMRERFLTEARNAARLTHPNVVLVLDTGEQGGRPFLVMECLPGWSLRDELRTGGLPVDRATQIARDVLAGLMAAHDAGIIHRDITPSNILLTDDGHAKIADFGIAKAAEGMSYTMIGQVLGTPAYLSPERLQGKPATAADDVYALGVVLYEALTGERLFRGATPVAVAQAVMSAEVPPLRVGRPDVPPALAAAVDDAMRRPRSRRTATAAAMLAQLDGRPSGVDAATGTIPVVATAPEPSTVAMTAMAAGGSASMRPSPWWAEWRAMPREVWFTIAAVAGVGLLLLAATHYGSHNNIVATDATTTSAVPAATPVTTSVTAPSVSRPRLVTAVVRHSGPGPKAKPGPGHGHPGG